MIRWDPWSASAMDVGGWLRHLGLGRYEALFRASEIDAEIEPELTDVDLEKLGVPLGHRKRLTRAPQYLPELAREAETTELYSQERIAGALHNPPVAARVPPRKVEAAGVLGEPALIVDGIEVGDVLHFGV
jgi:SAM domain (Sterile alpha motif)